MSRVDMLDWSMSFGCIGILLGLLMMTGTKIYLNNSQKRSRLFELGYSKESEWYQGKKVGFFDANFVVVHMVPTGLKLRRKKLPEKAMRMGSPLAPNLHLNENYNKFFIEFPFFVRWVLLEILIITISIGLMTFGMGLTKGWW